MRLGHRLLAVIAATLVATTGCAATTADDATESAESPLAKVSYDDVEDLDGAALKNALHDLVKDHKKLGYDRARDVLFSSPAFRRKDGKIECNYTGRLVAPDGTRTPSGFNTEHTWPQSKGAMYEPAKSDLHHLFAVDAIANGSRSNFPFGTATCLHDDPDAPTSSTCSYEKGGSGLGKDVSGKWAFEVRPQKRGNVARAMFYFSVRYDLEIPDAEETTLRAWHVEDPVDAREAARNDAIETLQNNRNPFIDRPDFVAKIADY